MNSKFTSIIRRLLGLLLIIFGSNIFLHFIPSSAAPSSAVHFTNSVNGMGYIFPIVGTLQVIIAIMLLMKLWDAFALILLTPISVNILLFHLYLGIPGLEIAIAIALLNGILIYKNRKMYNPLFIR